MLLGILLAKKKKSFAGKKAKNKSHNQRIMDLLAAKGFEPSTFGLWAQHASTAPSREGFIQLR